MTESLCFFTAGSNSIWEDYYVWKTEPAGNNAVNAILIAPEQWYELAIDGMERLETYEINGLTDWRVFTETEARELIHSARSYH